MVVAVVSAIGLALYPVAIHPKLFPQKYRKYILLSNSRLTYVQPQPEFIKYGVVAGAAKIFVRIRVLGVRIRAI